MAFLKGTLGFPAFSLFSHSNPTLTTRYLFLGWDNYHGFEYPTCPNNPDHGICYEPIIQSSCVQGTEPLESFVSYTVTDKYFAAFDETLENEGGWYMLLKCPECSGFGVMLENPIGY